MSQLDLFAGVEATQAARVAVYAGYSFGLIGHARASGFDEYLTGVVVTPKWAERCAQELLLDEEGMPPEGRAVDDSDPLIEQEEAPSMARVVLDNGAFPAWVRGEEMSLGAQLDGIHAGMERLGASVEWIVAPDVVADARKTYARLCACQLELESYGLHRLLLPVQDGMDLGRVASMAQGLECGVFVGGSGWRFKARALAALAAFELRWVHVGRASSYSQLRACAEAGADACDSSSFLRAQHANVASRPSYRRALVEWACPRQTPTQPGHYPPPHEGTPWADRMGFYR